MRTPLAVGPSTGLGGGPPNWADIVPTSPGRLPTELERIFSRRAVRNLAGPRSFELGEKYATSGLVKKLLTTGSSAQATMQYAHTYQVQLWIEGRVGPPLGLPSRQRGQLLQARRGAGPRPHRPAGDEGAQGLMTPSHFTCEDSQRLGSLTKPLSHTVCRISDATVPRQRETVGTPFLLCLGQSHRS